jgi:hypothetical protein
MNRPAHIQTGEKLSWDRVGLVSAYVLSAGDAFLETIRNQAADDFTPAPLGERMPYFRDTLGRHYHRAHYIEPHLQPTFEKTRRKVLMPATIQPMIATALQRRIGTYGESALWRQRACISV